MKQNIVIKKENGNLQVNLSVTVYLFKEGDSIISFCPSLDLVGSGENERSAKKSFEIVMEEYLKYCISNNTLHEDLMKHGWKENRAVFEEPPFDVLYKKNSELRKIVSSSSPDYRRISIKRNVAAFA